MIERLSRFFHKEDPHKKAQIALARLMSQYNMEGMAFREGLSSTRREGEPRHVALGAWILPAPESKANEGLDFSQAVQGITYDLRRNGIGILSTQKVAFDMTVTVIPDKDGVWRFFTAKACHRSDRPGGWFLTGLHIEQIIEPDPAEVSAFREFIGEPTPEFVAEPEW